MFDQVYDLVADVGSPDEPATYTAGWSILLDPTTCPEAFLPFCGCFTGTVIAPGTDEATARAKILAEAGFNRGTLAAIQAAALRNLTTSFLIVQERTAASGSPDPYHLVIGFRPADLLTTEQELINACEAVKPAGIQITYVDSAGYTWDEAIHTWAADTLSWTSYFATQP